MQRLMCVAGIAIVGTFGPTRAAHAGNNIFPTWQHGTINDAQHRGLEFNAPQIDVLADFHGDLTNSNLVLSSRRAY